MMKYKNNSAKGSKSNYLNPIYLKNYNLSNNLNQMYIRNFYEYHHRIKYGETKTAKQEYNKKIHEDNKKKRLYEIESLHPSSSNPNKDGYSNFKGENNLDDDHYYLDEQIPLTKFRQKTRFKIKSNSNNCLLLNTLSCLNKKNINFEKEYKKCIKTWNQLNTSKQIQTYAYETLKDNYDKLEDDYNLLNHKYKCINKECTLISKDMERLKQDYELVKNDLIKKNQLIKENNHLPIYSEIPFMRSLQKLGNLSFYDQNYNKYTFCLDVDNQINSKLNLNHAENQNALINQSFKLNNLNVFQSLISTQVQDLIYLVTLNDNCEFLCLKIKQLIEDNKLFKNKIKCFQFDILNEKNLRSNQNKKKIDLVNQYSLIFDLDDEKINNKILSRYSRHTINVPNKLNEELNLEKKQIANVKFKLKHKELELKVGQLIKYKLYLENKLEIEQKFIQSLDQNNKTFLKENEQLNEKIICLKEHEKQYLQDNENLFKKIHHLTKEQVLLNNTKTK